MWARPFALLLVLSGCGDSPAPMLEPQDAAQLSPPDAEPGDYVPVASGAPMRVFVPERMRYLNDHALLVGPDERWHVIGITDDSTGMPFAEESFLHASSPSLFGAWDTLPDALEAVENEGCCIWAPHIVESSPGDYTMLYYTSGESLRRATSTDLESWERVPWESSGEGTIPGGRDPFMLRYGDQWLVYSVGVDEDDHGQILVTWSDELEEEAEWTAPKAVITDPVPSFPWGNLESPNVIPYAGRFYLFVTRTAENDSLAYVTTLVFRSEDPTSFEWEPITTLLSHAGELIIEDDQWYLSSAGWTIETGEAARGLTLTPLQWLAD